MAAYSIDIVFDASWPHNERAALEDSAQRWGAIITAPLPPVSVDGRRIDGLRLGAAVIGGQEGGAFAQAGPLKLRPAAAGTAAYLPATATLAIDAQDFAMLAADGRLPSVLFHELGHALGFGMIWDLKGLIEDSGGRDPRFVGVRAKTEFGRLTGAGPSDVPIENSGGAGAANRHWRETVFGDEIMSTYVPTAHNPMSRLTLASMQDLGYEIDMRAAQDYALPRALGQWNKQWDLRLPSYKVRPTQFEILPDDALIMEDSVDGRDGPEK